MVFLRQNTVYSDIEIDVSAIFLTAKTLMVYEYMRSLTQSLFIGQTEAGRAK